MEQKNLLLQEHESVEWILKTIPINKPKNVFKKKKKIDVTCIDVNHEMFVMASNDGFCHIIFRRTNHMKSILIKKNANIVRLKLIHAIDLCVGFGCETGELFVLVIPIRDFPIYQEASIFTIKADHKTPITYLCWSKNSEKLFSGDVHGSVYCNEINFTEKNVTSYRICQCGARILQLSYDFKCLIISTERENFLWNLTTNSKVQIGKKIRTEIGRYGAAFINKLCVAEEAELVMVRPDCKIWLSDVKGTVKKTVILNGNMLFRECKAIPVLPSQTSQKKNDDLNQIKYQLGNVVCINESSILCWSSRGVLLVDIGQGSITASSCQLGSVQDICVCDISGELLEDSFGGQSSRDGGRYMEIWAWRTPIEEGDNRLVRLSNIPLTPSKLSIDTLYLSKKLPQQINQSNSSNMTTNQSNPTSVTNSPSATHKHTASVIIVNEEETDNREDLENSVGFLEQMTGNMKKLIRGGQEILMEKTGQWEVVEEVSGVEQALEITEEGVHTKDVDESVTLIKRRNSNRRYSIPEFILKQTIGTKSGTDTGSGHQRIIHVAQLEDEDAVESSISRSSVQSNEKKNELQVAEPINTQSRNEVIENDEVLEDDVTKIEVNRDTTEPVSIGSVTGDKTQEQVFPSSNPDDEMHEEEDDKDPPSPFENIDGAVVSVTSYEEDERKRFDWSNYQKNFNSYSIIDEEEKPKKTLLSSFGKKSSDSSLDKNKFELSLGKKSDSSIGNKSDLSDDKKESLSTKKEYSNFWLNKSIDKELFDDEPEDIIGLEVSNEIDVELNELNDSILTKTNKWIHHRGPLVQPIANKLVSLAVNRRIIWIIDNKGGIYVGVRDSDSSSNSSSNKNKTSLFWLQDLFMHTDTVATSPSGSIIYRGVGEAVQVYTGITKIWTSRVVKEKVLNKDKWDSAMKDIKYFDIDEEMAVIVTNKGALKVMNNINSRYPYRQTKTANVAGHVTMATCLNGIIWCVTEVVELKGHNQHLSQHIFACSALTEHNSELTISYWKMVPLTRELIGQFDSVTGQLEFGNVTGTNLIVSLHLGVQNLAWLHTRDCRVFFCTGVTHETPNGNGLWFQISLAAILESPSSYEGATYLLGLERKKSSGPFKSVLLSTKMSPKGCSGNGLIWLTTCDKTSPAILFESNMDMLGHCWTECLSANSRTTRIIGLPAILEWLQVVQVTKSHLALWLIHKSKEIFCWWDGTKIRSIPVPHHYGRVSKLVSCKNTVVGLTHAQSNPDSRQLILLRTGVTNGNPAGIAWSPIKLPSLAEPVQHLSCTEDDVFFIQKDCIFTTKINAKIISDHSAHIEWKIISIRMDTIPRLASFEVNELHTNAPSHDTMYSVWIVSELDGKVYMGTWASSTAHVKWTLIPGPKARLLRLSDTNVWMQEKGGRHSLFVLCGLESLTNDPSKCYWVDVPSCSVHPLLDISVSMTTPNNRLVVIDERGKLMQHKWTVVSSTASSSLESSIVTTAHSEHTSSHADDPLATKDPDWELLF